MDDSEPYLRFFLAVVDGYALFYSLFLVLGLERKEELLQSPFGTRLVLVLLFILLHLFIYDFFNNYHV